MQMELQSIPQFEIHCSENETGISNRKTQLLLHTGKSFPTLDKSYQNQLPIDLEPNGITFGSESIEN